MSDRGNGLVWLGVFCATAALVGGTALGAEGDAWRDLIGGDLSAWHDGSGNPPKPGWVLQDGALVRQGRAGYIWTKERFDDFLLELEFRTEGNSGVFIRTDNPKDPVQTGLEIQIYTPRKNPSKGSCGAVYDCLAPTKDVCKADAWNALSIMALDNELTVTLNGEKIIAMDLNRWTEPHRNPDGTRNKFRTAIKDFKRDGHIGFQDHGATVAYRNVRIKPLKSKK